MALSTRMRYVFLAIVACAGHAGAAGPRPPGEVRLLTIDNSKRAQGMNGVCPDYYATAFEYAINKTMEDPEFAGKNLSIRLRVVDGGNTTASYARKVFQQVDDFEPCLMFGPFGSLLGSSATYQVGTCTSELNIPWVPITDSTAETVSLKDVYPSTLNLMGGGLGAGTALPALFKLLLQRNIRRMALILPASSVKMTSKISDEAKFQGIDVYPEYINIESPASDASLKGEFTAAFTRIKARRYSNIGMFLTRMVGAFSDWIYEEADRIGLACKGCQWYLSCGGGGGECPFDLWENFTSTKHRSFVGARTFEAFIVNPPGDTEDLGAFNKAFMSVFTNANVVTAKARAFYLENFGKYVGVEGGSCGYASPQDWPDWLPLVLYAGGYMPMKLMLRVLLRAHQAGYCSAPLRGTPAGIRGFKQILMSMKETDPDMGSVQFECGARGTYTSLEDCTKNPSKKTTYVERILGEYYPPTMVASPTTRFTSVVTMAGNLLPYDAIAGMPADAVAMMFTGKPTRWQNGLLTPPKDYIPDSCGNRAYINESAPDRACVSCPRGLANPMDGSNGCTLEFAERCDAGTVWDFVDRSCKACLEGTFAKDPGMTECVACSPGTFAGARASLQCTDCPAGYVAPSAGSNICTACKRSFWRRSAGEPCMACGEGETTAEVATNSQDGCLCEPGRLRLLDRSCALCNAQAAICPGLAEEAVIISRPFFSLGSRGDGTNVPTPYACQWKDDCPGDLADGQCPETHEGVACADCQQGFARSGRSCVNCSGSTNGRGWWIAAAIAAFIVACAVMLKVFSMRNKVYISTAFALSTMIGIFINYMQLGGQLVLVSIEWPRGSSEALDICSFVSLDISSIQFGCIFGDSRALRFGTKFFLIIAALVVTLILTLLAEIYDRVFKTCNFKLRIGLEGLVNTWGIIANTAFVPMAMQGFSMFNCYQHPEGGSSMKDLPGVLCYQSAWNKDILPIGVLCLLVTLTTLITFLWIVLRVPGVPGAAARYRFLFQRFRPDCYYWNLVILLRNLAFALCPSIAPDNSFVVAFLISCVCSVYLGMLITKSPWKFPLHVRLDTAAIVALNMTVNVGVTFTRTPTYANAARQDGSEWVFLKVCAGLPFALVSVVALLNSLRAFLATRIDSRPTDLEGASALLQEMTSELRAVFQAIAATPQLKEDLRRNMENLSIYDIADIKRTRFLVKNICLGGASQGSRTRSFGSMTAGSNRRIHENGVNDLTSHTQSDKGQDFGGPTIASV